MTATKPEATTSRPVEAGGPAVDAAKPGYITGIADGNLAQGVGLRDYLFGVGVVFRLDKKRRARAKKAAEEKRHWAAHVPVVLIAKMLIPVAIAVAAYLGFQQLSGEAMPNSVVGTWSSNDGRYAGRTFWLNPTDIAFQNGDGTTAFSTHPIRKITTRQSADTLFVSVDYDQGGSVSTFSIAYHSAPGPEIRLVNQPRVRWLKTGPAPAIRQ
jgi:hypothetical protein